MVIFGGQHPSLDLKVTMGLSFITYESYDA